MTEHDYSDYQTDDMVGDNLMSCIEGLAREQLDAEARIESIEAQLAEAKLALRAVKERKLPELIDEAQLGDSSITTPSGLVVKVGEVIRGSIPKGNEPRAFEWLEDNDNGNLIKRTITIEFGKGEEAWANKFERDCAQRKKPLNLKRKKGVNPMTLQAFVRQQLDAGVAIPMDVFGVHRQRFAKVKVKA